MRSQNLEQVELLHLVFLLFLDQLLDELLKLRLS